MVATLAQCSVDALERMKVIGGSRSSVKGKGKRRRAVELLGRVCGLGWRWPKRKGRGGEEGKK